jgi:hypothetical protein
MSGSVVNFLRRAVSRDWSPQELAEFYRVEAALIQSGISLHSDRGVTDEGDPWFVFCRAEDGEIIVHFARIDGRYVISAPAYGGNASGSDFRALVRSMVESQPVLQPRQNRNTLIFHPAALLAVLVASAFLKVGHAAAAPVKLDSGHFTTLDRPTGRGPVLATSTLPTLLMPATAEPDSQHETILLSTVMMAAMALEASNPANSSLSPASQLAADFHLHLLTTLGSVLPEEAWWNTNLGAGSVTPAAAYTPMGPLLPADSFHAVPADSFHAVPAAATFQVNAGPTSIPVSSLVDLGSTSLILASSSSFPVASAMAPAVSFGTAAPTASSGFNTSDLALDLLQNQGLLKGVATQTNLPIVLDTILGVGLHEPVANVQSGTNANTSATAGTTTNDVAHISTSTTVSSSTPPQTDAGASSSHGTAPIDPAAAALHAVLAIVQAFEAEVLHPAAVVTNNQVIIYDPSAIETSPGAVKSVTYDFSDGSSISLVGLPNELPHHVHV